MNLGDFITEERARINAFVSYWIANNKQNPEAFPMEMGAGDWDEQLHMFRGG